MRAQNDSFNCDIVYFLFRNTKSIDTHGHQRKQGSWYFINDRFVQTEFS